MVSAVTKLFMFYFLKINNFMTNKIQLTFNLKGAWKNRDSELLTDSAKKLGYELVILSSYAMKEELEIPLAILNGGGTLNETHLRYTRKLELAGVKYLNPCYNILLAEEKILSNLEISSLGIRVPKTVDLPMGIRNPNMSKYIEQEIGFPCIIKHPRSAIGVGIYLVKTREDFRDLFDLLYTTSMRYMDFNNTVNLVVQEFIPTTKNKDLRVFVLDGKILGAMHRENPIGWNVKRVEWAPGFPETHADIIYTNFDVDAEVATNCINICNKLGLRFAGLDILFGNEYDKYIYGEINPCPGLNNFNNLRPDINLPDKILKSLLEI